MANSDRLITRWQPDVLSIALGTNDAHTTREAGTYSVDEFAANLLSLVALGADAGARVVVNTPCPILSTHTNRPHLADYTQACRDVAAETGALLVDHDAAWRAHFGGAEPTDFIDAGDEIHPNAAGHRFMATTFLAAVGLA